MRRIPTIRETRAPQVPPSMRRPTVLPPRIGRTKRRLTQPTSQRAAIATSAFVASSQSARLFLSDFEPSFEVLPWASVRQVWESVRGLRAPGKNQRFLAISPPTSPPATAPTAAPPQESEISPPATAPTTAPVVWPPRIWGSDAQEVNARIGKMRMGRSFMMFWWHLRFSGQASFRAAVGLWNGRRLLLHGSGCRSCRCRSR